jgi:hypothetical protein
MSIDEKDDINEEVVVLVGDKGDEHEFREIAIVALNDKTYICLEPIEELEGFEEGDLLIYQITLDENEEELFIPVRDELELDQVFKEFLRLQEEYEKK